MTANETILLVEDETDILLNNKEYLEKQGYVIITAETLKAASEVLDTARIDLILLDINLPDGSGLDYIHKLRETSDVPVIFLTGRTDKKDILEGLSGGGCDYITKPFDLDLLGARIAAQLRHTARKRTDEPLLRIGSFELHFSSRRALLDGRDLLLKPKEFALLEVLARGRDKYFTAEELYEKLWGMDTADDVRTIWEHISRIRQKLGGNAPVGIVSERRRGYRMINKSAELNRTLSNVEVQNLSIKKQI